MVGLSEDKQTESSSRMPTTCAAVVIVESVWRAVAYLQYANKFDDEKEGASNLEANLADQ